MGWSQPRHASPTATRRGPEHGVAHQIVTGRSDLGGAVRLRTAFVMNDELLRHGLVHVMSQAGCIEFVGDLRHGVNVAERLRDMRPELLVVGMDPDVSLTDLLAEFDPVPKVVVVVDGQDAPGRALELIRAGADALVDRRSPSAELMATVTKVIDGQTALDAYSVNTVMAELRSQAATAEFDLARVLTRREKEVLTLLTDGLDNRAIATELFISEATVKFHLHNIMDKFGVHKRAALVSVALRGRPRGGTDGVRPTARIH